MGEGREAKSTSTDERVIYSTLAAQHQHSPVQHTQPLFMSTMFSLSICCMRSRWSSMPSLPISFSMTSTRMPCVLWRMFFTRVVLPARERGNQPVDKVTIIKPISQ